MPSKPKCVACNVMPVFFTAEEMCRSCGIALGFDTIPSAPAPPARKKSAAAEQPPDQSTPEDQED